MTRIYLTFAVAFTVFSVMNAEAVNKDHRHVWHSQDGSLTISASLVAHPEGDPDDNIAVVAVGEIAEFTHSGRVSEVKGVARLILYHSTVQRLELYGWARLREGKNSYR